MKAIAEASITEVMSHLPVELRRVIEAIQQNIWMKIIAI
jgi:hypothetical protein